MMTTEKREIRLEKFPTFEEVGDIRQIIFYPGKSLRGGPVYLPEWTARRTVKKEVKFLGIKLRRAEIESKKYYNVILYPKSDGSFPNTDWEWFNHKCFLGTQIEEVNIDGTTHGVSLGGIKLDLGFPHKAELLERVPEVRLIFENDDNYWYYYFKTNQKALEFVRKLEKLGYLGKNKETFFTEEESGYTSSIIDLKDLENYLKIKIEEYRK